MRGRRRNFYNIRIEFHKSRNRCLADIASSSRNHPATHIQPRRMENSPPYLANKRIVFHLFIAITLERRNFGEASLTTISGLSPDFSLQCHAQDARVAVLDGCNNSERTIEYSTSSPGAKLSGPSTVSSPEQSGGFVCSLGAAFSSTRPFRRTGSARTM